MACLQLLLPDGDPGTEAGGSLEEQEGLTRSCGMPTALAVKAPDCPTEETCQGPGHYGTMAAAHSASPAQYHSPQPLPLEEDAAWASWPSLLAVALLCSTA